MELRRKAWYLDSGSTSHMCNSKESSVSLKDVEKDISVSVGNREETALKDICNISCRSTINGTTKETTFMGALFVSFLMCYLLSVSRIREKGFSVCFESDEEGYVLYVVRPKGIDITFLKGIERSDLMYELFLSLRQNIHGYTLQICALSLTHQEYTWHKRLGHASSELLSKTTEMVKSM